jgi:hypothetical protein
MKRVTHGLERQREQQEMQARVKMYQIPRYAIAYGSGDHFHDLPPFSLNDEGTCS